jgi:hypothetical protein
MLIRRFGDFAMERDRLIRNTSSYDHRSQSTFPTSIPGFCRTAEVI